MVSDLERESAGLQNALSLLASPKTADKLESDYDRFFKLLRRYSPIETLDRETLLTFVERIEVGPKQYPEGVVRATHPNQPYRQSIRIFYKFVGEVSEEPIRALPQACQFMEDETPA